MPPKTSVTRAVRKILSRQGGIPDGPWAYHNGGKDKILKDELRAAGATSEQAFAIALTALHAADGDMAYASCMAHSTLIEIQEDTDGRTA